MAINTVPMQPGLSLAEFMGQYGREARCEQALAASRWPRGSAYYTRRSGGPVVASGSANAIRHVIVRRLAAVED